LSLEAFRIRLKSYARDARAGVGRSWLIIRAGDGAMVGGVTLSDIRRAPFQCAIVGYWVGAPFLRRGLATAALEAALAHGFGALGLNRIEAACQRENEASRRVLMRCGFSEEGVTRAYLFINGAWRDHLRFARLAN
jgi:ribosomal-protein-alanine N-acetyltransferase